MSNASNDPSKIPPAPSSSDELSPAIPDDPRLIRAVQEYLGELEAGRRPDRSQWLARYPDLAEALGQCLDGLEIVHREAPLLNSLATDPAIPGESPRGEHPPIPLGDFQIIGEIGRGGMGVVYEALQLSLGRRVALKVLPLAATFDAKHLQRFRQEAQAAAQLHHSNIVPVHAVGCERGIHFYAMQLIEGQSLEAIIRQLRQQTGLKPGDGAASAARSAGSQQGRPGSVEPDSTDVWRRQPTAKPAVPCDPTETDRASETLRQCSQQFSTHGSAKDMQFYRAAARCMAQAAEALEYAHQQGIIHRDIKPANLLVDVRGNVWITDFGLAHFHSNPGLTATGDVIGTVRYMSPEQASGQHVVLDHRTDVYSLGATFYELLTLQPMFAGSSRHSILFQVLNRDPRSPRSIDRRIPPELETILLKTLNKNAVDRYGSAQQLADDLHRFLRDEPIWAKRPSLLEHVRKWSRRHPSLIGAGVLVMFLTLVVSLVSNWLITQANERTKTALTQEQLRAEEAQTRFRQARQAVDLLIEVSEEELADKPPLQGVRKRLLEAALVYYQDFIAQRSDDPSSQAELIAVEKRLKKILDDLSVIEGAGQLLLLSDQRVQTELAFRRDQREQIDTLTQQFAQVRRDSLRDFDRLTPAERRSKFVALARTNDQSMRTILTPAQLKRLGQITLQIQGLMAFSRPEIVAQLRLTDSQRDRVRQIEAEIFAFLMQQVGPDDHRPAAESARGKLFHDAMDKAVKTLTPEQLAQWKTLVGEPFEAATDMPPHRFMLAP